MRVVFVVPWFHTNLYFALRALLRHGVQPTLVVRYPDTTSLDGVRLLEMVPPVSLGAARRVLREERPDLVVIRKTKGVSAAFHRAALLQRRAMVGYDQRPLWRPRPPGHAVRGLLKGRPAYRFTPVHGLPTRERRLDPTATYLPFPVEGAVEQAVRAWAPDGIVRILCVGRLVESRKNQHGLLQALETLAPDADFRVTLVGGTKVVKGVSEPAHLERLRRYARDGPLADRVTLREDASFEEMPAIYASHDLCVLPSLSEPLGTAPLEAMAYGCAAVVSATCGSAWYVEGAKEAGLPCGEVVPTGDQAALTETLRRLLSRPGDLPRLGENALAWTRREFSEDRFSERFLALADRLGARVGSR